ncbi:enoyl-CoA hydratase/isomerase family protein [Ruania halotolerans]|uniref:enoyl-CoA hydratase/isomerase family protein n=1 Tax=Ruania halotolerans TaxID=2897773 RepID=UPI001E487B45|nr:enoyl-CoA hydratase/isomerase family protein [Ruania halotolerans]UFU06845.1 enoyl-CoA hydratase/isomerase family protein [Ruania halotolerans]
MTPGDRTEDGSNDAHEPRWTPAGENVLVARQGALGRIRLNRPAALNALTLEMVQATLTQLHRWADEGAVCAVALDGAGDRGLCAGGDVRAIRDWLVLDGPGFSAPGTAGADRRPTDRRGADREGAGADREGAGADRAVQFWTSEYALNRLIADAELPVAAFMDGVVMGGGIGLAGHASLRLVTPRTRVAMPETGIGFFPDVGALFPLSRAPGELGTYLALTGATVSGADAIAVGLADAMIEPDGWPDLCAQWADGAPLTPADSTTRSDPWIDQPPTSDLTAQRRWIDACFTGTDPAAIESRLRTRPEPEAQEAAEMLRSRCPFSVAVTLEAIRRAAELPTVADVLAQDLRLGAAFMRGDAAADFIEGVRAVLVDRDHAPQWRHDSLAAVDRREVLEPF